MVVATEVLATEIDAAALVKAREAAGFSQAEAARRLGIARQTLWSYENEDGLPSAKIFARMCILYDTRAESLTKAA
jgi:alanine-synthesizing transaminase